MAVSFATQSLPLFTQTDIDHMSFFCDLSSYATSRPTRRTSSTGCRASADE